MYLSSAAYFFLACLLFLAPSPIMLLAVGLSPEIKFLVENIISMHDFKGERLLKIQPLLCLVLTFKKQSKKHHPFLIFMKSNQTENNSTKITLWAK